MCIDVLYIKLTAPEDEKELYRTVNAEASLVVQTIKHLPAMQETQVRSLGREDPLEKEMTTHSSTLAWRIPMDRGAWWATVHGVANSWTRLSD